MSIAVSPIDLVFLSAEVPTLQSTVLAGATSRLASYVLAFENYAHCFCKSLEPSEKKVSFVLYAPQYVKFWKV